MSDFKHNLIRRLRLIRTPSKFSSGISISWRGNTKKLTNEFIKSSFLNFRKKRY